MTVLKAPRALLRCLLLVAVTVAILLSTAAPAQAHPTLLFTTPAADTAVAEPPSVITLLFNERVTLGEAPVVVGDASGAPQPMDRVTTGRDGSAVVAPLPGDLQPGSYVVRWRVTGADGDVVEGEFRFTLGTAVAGDSAAGGGPSIAWLTAALRWALFVGLAVALGGLVAQRVTDSARLENLSLPAIRSWAPFGALAGLAGVAGLWTLLGPTSGVDVLWTDRPGQLLAVEAAGFALALLLLALRRTGWGAAPLLLVAVAEGVRSHAGVALPGWGALLTGVHLVAASVWAGALLHTVRSGWAWRAHRGAVRWVFAEYARTALWWFLLVVATGSLSTLLLVPATALITTDYGVVLLTKIALVALAAGFALAGRSALRRPSRVRRLASTESAALVAVLAVAAALVSTPPPGSTQQAAPPPAVTGVVLPLGARAGQVGITMAASQGQLVVRLSTPRRGDYYEVAEPQEYILTGSLDRERSPAALQFRPCGEGCFVAAIDWTGEDNLLTLRVAAPGWSGGTVGALVPWPARAGHELLARTVATMRRAGDFTMYETVTSDTSEPAREPHRLDLSASLFLSSLPYTSGVAPLAARVSPADSPTRLALGFPAAGQTAMLVIDGEGRIAEQTLVTEKHLVRQRLIYPAGEG